MKTIARNHTKKIDRIFDHVSKCTVHTMEEGFKGRKVDPKYARKDLETFPFARLVQVEPGWYTVNVTNRTWYELRA